MSWYIEALKKYAAFSGRAQRKEFWYFNLFNFLITLAIGIVGILIFGINNPHAVNFPMQIYGLVMLIPALAVSVRRLHDIDRSGWWALIPIIPLVGFIVWLVFMAKDSNEYENRFGPSPKLARV